MSFDQYILYQRHNMNLFMCKLLDITQILNLLKVTAGDLDRDTSRPTFINCTKTFP